MASATSIMLVETQAINLKLLEGGGSQFAKAWPAPCSQVGDNLQEDVVGSVLSALTGAHILGFQQHARLLAPPKCGLQPNQYKQALPG